MEQIRYRHEYKYPLTRGQVLIERARISPLMTLDSHVGAKGCYNIRSLYFDDYQNSCYTDNENGVDNREKFRIRIYDHNPGRIQLELKQKIRGKNLQALLPHLLSQCRALMEGKIPADIRPKQQVLHKLSYLMAVRLMRPAVIVAYDRIPYIYRPMDANVRVTFDSNILSCSDIPSFLEEGISGRGILPQGQALMEVKFDSFLPDEIHSLLQLEGLSASTFSKYYLCRKFKFTEHRKV